MNFAPFLKLEETKKNNRLRRRERERERKRKEEKQGESTVRVNSCQTFPAKIVNTAVLRLDFGHSLREKNVSCLLSPSLHSLLACIIEQSTMPATEQESFYREQQYYQLHPDNNNWWREATKEDVDTLLSSTCYPNDEQLRQVVKKLNLDGRNVAKPGELNRAIQRKVCLSEVTVLYWCSPTASWSCEGEEITVGQEDTTLVH